MTDWKKYAEDHTFTVEVDGGVFLCAKPSAAQLTARGVLPPALTMNQLVPNTAALNGDRQRLLLDEKAQDALLDAVLIEPRIWDGPYAECPEAGHVPRRALAKIKDVLVIAILAQLYDVDLVRGAAFRGGKAAGGDPRARGETLGDAGDGGAAPSRRRAGGRNRAHGGGLQGA